MAALDFPSSPALDDVYTANGTSFQWDGAVWRPISSTFINDGSFVYYDGPLNVGIGTQTPSTKLQVSGTITATAFVGSGTGISNVDAATLDGIDSTQFLRSDQNDVTSGRLTVNGGLVVGTSGSPRASSTTDLIEIHGSTSSMILGVQDGNGRIQWKWNANRGTGETYLVSGEPAASMELIDVTNPTNSLWRIRYAASGTAGNAISWGTDILQLGTTAFNYNGNAVWHAGNDGAGSGLDADLLDGQEGAYYLDYANFSNTPAIPSTTSDISEGSNLYFTNERVDDRVAALLVGGTGITLDYNDTAGTLTINGSTLINDTDDVAEGSANLYFTEERVDDRVSNLLVAGTNITLTYDDGANTLTIDAASGGGGFDLSGNDLTDVGDVSAIGLGNADILIYNSTASQWQPQNLSGDVLISNTGVVTIQNNAVTLGTNTTGNYVATVAGTTNEIEVTGSGSETAAVIIGLPDDVTVTGTLTVGGDILPPADNQGNVGTAALSWNDGHFTNFQVDSVLIVRGRIDLADNDAVTFGSSDDFRVFYDGTNNTAEMELETAATSLIITDNGTTRFTFTKATGNLTASSFTGDLIGNADTATALETARTIGGVSFDGTSNINLPGVNIAGNQNTTGNAATASELQTARTISLTGDATGSVSFDGSGNVSINTTVVGGSVSDADTLDGLDSTAFIRSNVDDAFTGTIEGVSDGTNPVLIISGGGPNIVRFEDTSGASADTIDLVYRTTPNTLGFERSSDETEFWSTDADTGVTNFAFDPTVNGNRILTVADEGSGNGLDADTLDGVQGANYARTDIAETFTQNVIITGDLTVNGTTTTVNSNTVNIGDNIIVLNADETGVPSQDGGIEIERGTGTNRRFIWDESTDRWSTEGQNLDAGTFIGALSGNATTASTLQTARTISLGGDLSGSASFNGGSNITISATVSSNAVALGTNTTGNYVATIAGTANEIEVSGSGTESAAVTIGLPDDVIVTGQLTVGANLVPDTDNTGNVGTSALTWADGEFTNFRVNSTLEVRGAVDLADNDQVRWGSSDDFRMFYDGTNNTMEMELEAAATALIITDNATERFRFTKTTGDLSATSFTGDLNGNATTASTLQTARTIALSGDVTGSASFNGGSNITIATTIQPNSIVLGTDTTGNYVSTITGTANEIEVTGSGSESAGVTVGLPNSVTLQNTLTALGTGVHTFGTGNNTIRLSPLATSFRGGFPMLSLSTANGEHDGILIDMDDDQGSNNFYALNVRVSDSPQGHIDNTNTRFLVNAEGRLLLNRSTTTSTTHWLDVNGSALITGQITKGTLPVPSISTSDTPPGSPAEGDLWYNTINGSLYVYYTDATPDSYWVEAGGNTGQGSSGAGGSSPFVDTGSFVYYGGPNNVGIGTATPGEALEVIGNIEASEDVIAYSDRRYKEDIETIDSALNIIAEMRGVRYTKKSTGRRSVGVIAQEVQEVLPEVVHADADGMLSVAYGNIVGVLVEAVKEQKTEIDLLKEQMAVLIERVNKLDGN